MKRQAVNVSRETSPEARFEPWLTAVASALGQLGLKWDEEVERKWSRYFSTFEIWSGRTNLVSRADRSRWVEKHVLPSLRVLERVEIPGGSTIADVGTGAGFPGIPLALARPDCEFVLIESKRWRVLFLEELREVLGLSNVTVVGDRVESRAVREKWKNSLDFALARAVAGLETLWEWCRPLLKRDGALVAFKGFDEAKEEANFLSLRNRVEIEILPFEGEQGTVLVVVRPREVENAG